MPGNVVTTHKNNEKKIKSNDTEIYLTWIICISAVFHSFLLLAIHPNPDDIRTILLYIYATLLILSAILCLRKKVYWGALSFVFALIIFYFTLGSRKSTTNVKTDMNTLINGIIFIIDCVIFFSYLAMETFKRIDRTVIPAITSFFDSRRSTRIRKQQIRVYENALPGKSTRRRWRLQSKR